MKTIPESEKKGITVKIDAGLHAEVRRYLGSHEMTMTEFITLAIQDELHPKINITEAKNMGNVRTLAFQVPEELFHKIKDYLQRNNMTQKEFVIGLIEKEIDRDLAQRASMNQSQTNSEAAIERREEAVEGDLGEVFERVGEQPEEQNNVDFSGDFDTDNEQYGSLNVDEELEEDETEDMGLSMGM